MHARGPVFLLVWLGACGTEAVDRAPARQCLPWEDPHDGIDQDCFPANEYDFDGDGFIVDHLWSPTEGWVDALPAARAFALQHGLSVDAIQVGDCDDFDPGVYPGAPGEQPYDAVDTDCDGANDFDVDGDGWIPVGYWNAMAYYVAEYLDGQATFEILEGDCDDADALVNPDAEDVPYDGRDTNCDHANDFDFDGDAYVAVGMQDAWLEHVAANGTQHTIAGFGDCDDINAFVNPGAPERMSTPRDVDCDGQPERPRLGVLELGIVGGGPAAFAQGEVYQVLAFGAEAAGTNDERGLYGLVLPLMVAPDAVVGVQQLADSPPDLLAVRPEGNGVGIVTVEADRWAMIPLATGFLGSPTVEPYAWVEAAVDGTQLVGVEAGDFVCGGSSTFSLDGSAIGGAVGSCGVLEEAPVLCDPDCIAVTGHDDMLLPWSAPTRITGGHALIDGRVYASDGSQPFGITGADDAAVSGEWAAWIDDGTVHIEGPAGMSGPLVAVASDWAERAEVPVSAGFYADEVHIGAYWGRVTVLAIAYDGPEFRVAMARIDP